MGPVRTHHDGGSHQGGVRAPAEACAPPMMRHALYKGAHMYTPPHFHLILGLQLYPHGCLLGSWVEVLGPTPTSCHFFATQIEFLNSIFRNDIDSRRSARCYGTQDAKNEGQEGEAKKNEKTWKEEAPHPPRRYQEGLRWMGRPARTMDLSDL
jgi:hypothetical protein